MIATPMGPYKSLNAWSCASH